MAPQISKQRLGFTLIEIMVAIIIFAIISVVSYRIISSLVTTKEVAGKAQEKWGNLSLIMSNLGSNINRTIPLVIRNQDGTVLPAVYGNGQLNSLYDGQLELSLSGYIGDQVIGSVPPKRVGYRFSGGSLYLVTWPVLNRVLTTKPQIDLLIENVKNFSVSFLYPDNQWRNIWPLAGSDPTQIPQAIKIVIILNSGETIERLWQLK
jgi:general secretion pathway protein J